RNHSGRASDDWHSYRIALAAPAVHWENGRFSVRSHLVCYAVLPLACYNMDTVVTIEFQKSGKGIEIFLTHESLPADEGVQQWAANGDLCLKSSSAKKEQ